jgi:hypothetical protein
LLPADGSRAKDWPLQDQQEVQSLAYGTKNVFRNFFGSVSSSCYSNPMRSLATKIMLIIGLVLVSMHTVPVAHAGFLGGQVMLHGHNCAEHVHEPADHKMNSDPQPVIRLAFENCARSVGFVATTHAIPTKREPKPLSSRLDALSSLSLRPPIPPPTA